MKKLKKLLLISSSLVLASCSGWWDQQGLPKAPSLNEGGPVYAQDANGNLYVSKFHMRNTVTGDSYDLSVEQAKEVVVLSTDLDSYNNAEAYRKEVERIAKKRCH